MVDVVKAALYIPLDKPPCAVELPFQGFQRRVAASVRPKSVGYRQENRFINCFQHHTQGFLHQLVRECGDSQGTLLFRAVLFLDIGSSDRGRLIGFVSELLNDFCYFCFAEPICCIIRCSLCCRSLVCIQIFVGCKINVRAQQVAVQFREYFFLVFQ